MKGSVIFVFDGNIVFGTMDDLLKLCINEYINNRKSWNIDEILFSPTENIYCKYQSGHTILTSTPPMTSFNLKLSNSEDEQLSGKKIFDSSYIHGFEDGMLRVGAVYKLTIAAAYKNSSGITKTHIPKAPGDWGEWENYYSSHEAAYDCALVAAVMLIDGEKGIHKDKSEGIPIKSQRFTLLPSAWTPVTNQNKVFVILDTSKLNRVIPTLSETEWTSCGVRPIIEEANGITFTCSSVPTSSLTFFVVSEEVAS